MRGLKRRFEVRCSHLITLTLTTRIEDEEQGIERSSLKKYEDPI